MSAKAVVIAEAVKDSLNAGTFAEAFTATRQTIPPDSDLASDLSSVRVVVVPGQSERTQGTRSSQQKDFDTEICIQKKIQSVDGVADQDELDEMSELVEQIADHFAPGQLGNTGARWVRTRQATTADTDHLRSAAVFSSLVVVTHRFI